jgi:hypothetical protein
MTAMASSIVLFGGGGRPPTLGDTWSFDGTLWTQVQDIGPLPRFSHALTFDSTRGGVVLFRGLDARPGEVFASQGRKNPRLRHTA